MEAILKFLESYEFVIYILLGAVLLWYFRKLIIDWHEWRSALFGLERESALRRLSTALTFVIILSMMLAAEFLIVSFVVPVYPKTNLLVTPTVNLMITPSATIPADRTAGVETTKIAVAASPTGVVQPGCTSGQIEWTSPKNGDEVSGSINLKGTINVNNLGFFKYEFSQPNSDSWVTIAAGNTPGIDQLLGTWNTETLIPGDYLLRLVVNDNQNNPYPICQISIRVIAPTE
jgi:hypothetical protein